MPRIGLCIEITDVDPDLLTLRVRAGNGDFAADVEFYTGRDALDDFIAALRGFPTDFDDLREFTLGQYVPEPESCGGVRLVFRCTAPSGRPEVLVSALSGPDSRATFPIALEPAAVDAFVEELGELVRGERVEARLLGGRS